MVSKLILSFGLFIIFAFSEPKICNVRILFNNKNSTALIDGFANVYVLHVDEIKKFNTQGNFQKTFSNKRYGTIQSIDVTNPLKVLVYYRDFQQVLFLDNQLSPTSNIISLENLGYEQASLVCTSLNNSFWLYDKQNNELVRFDSELKSLLKTGNLKRILNMDIKPNFMREHGNYLYLNCPDEGILMFDIYGTYYKTIPVKNLSEFSVINGNIFYFQKQVLKEYQSQNFITVEKPFRDTLIKNVYWLNNRYYKLFADSLVCE